MIKRKKTKQVDVGGVLIGGDSRISIQSMLNIPPDDIESNVKQAAALKDAGCDIIRVAVPKIEDVKLIYSLKDKLDIPVVADIHFNHKIALAAVDAGADKIRINPGNIGDNDRVSQVVTSCKAKNIPIRVGVNSGSIEKNILAKHGGPTPEALVESGFYHIDLIEKFDYDKIVLSLKSSDVGSMIKAYRIASKKCDYPLHLGVTEAGSEKLGIIKSSVGIGSLLVDGIGDTIRVSLTADPIKEIEAAENILKSVGILKKGVNIISCPSCGRCNINLIELTHSVEEALAELDKNVTVAVMGCAVNGPGEAREADFGVAGGDGQGLIFKKGEIIKKVPEQDIVKALINEIKSS